MIGQEIFTAGFRGTPYNDFSIQLCSRAPKTEFIDKHVAVHANGGGVRGGVQKQHGVWSSKRHEDPQLIR